jgi:F0F1-type ATP synthase gamma subunit
VTDEIIVMGERGARYLSEMYRGAFTVLPALGDEVSYERAGTVRDLLVDKYMGGRVGKVLVVHARFLSLTVQEPFATKLLPCPELFRPPDDSRRFRPGQKKRPAFEETVVEPGLGHAVDFLVRATLTQQLHSIFIDSKLAEYAARIVHLEGSYQEITEMNRRVIFSFFKHLHQKSDKDIREIFASRLKGARAAHG